MLLVVEVIDVEMIKLYRSDTFIMLGFTRVEEFVYMARPIMVILGGGAGKGLYPLTKTRSKAAVPFGTKYRLVDIAISNCINSEYYQIFVLTQFNSGSVNRHIVQTYQIPPFLDGFVDPRAASLTADNRHWYQGTADAVRQNLGTICGAAEISNAQQVMIVSGDHLYHMDYRKVMDFHLKKGADVTLCVNPVQRDRASTLGIAQWDDDHRVTRFVEKPKDDALIDSLQIPHDAEEFPGAFLGSMGLYVFEIEWLKQFLTDHSDRHEFGREFLPGVVGSSRVFAYAFEDYWENVGDIRSYYDAMMQLCKPNPRFDFDPVINNHRHRLFTRGRSLPPAKINGATFENAMIAEGAILEVRTQISNSLVGMRAFIDTDVVMRTPSCLVAMSTRRFLSDSDAFRPVRSPSGLEADHASRAVSSIKMCASVVT